jgi:secondary thiamine-phosphate synthase enzyme
MAFEAGKASPAVRTTGRAHTFQIETHSRVEFKDITALVQKLVEESDVRSGVCYIFVPHTTAALLINENDDPALQKDLDKFLEGLAPVRNDYHHNDGNCDAHLKASIIGGSKTLLIEDRRLVLGRWQGIIFCEFDGPRRRELRVKIVGD